MSEHAADRQASAGGLLNDLADAKRLREYQRQAVLNSKKRDPLAMG